MKNILIILFLSAAGALTAETTPPIAPVTTGADKPYPFKTCLVSGNDLDSMGEQASFIHEGQVIKVCCKPCIAKFNKNPAKYLAKLTPTVTPAQPATPVPSTKP